MSKAQELVNALLPSGKYAGAVGNVALQGALDAIIAESNAAEVPAFYAYVDNNTGDDSNSGTPESPYATIQKAHDQLLIDHGMLARKTIVITGGTTYTEGLIVRSKNVTLIGVDGPRPDQTVWNWDRRVKIEGVDDPIILTDMSEDGLEEFRLAGGASYTVTPYAYTGATLAGRERQPDIDSGFFSNVLNFKMQNIECLIGDTTTKWGGQFAFATFFTDGDPGAPTDVNGVRLTIDNCIIDGMFLKNLSDGISSSFVKNESRIYGLIMDNSSLHFDANSILGNDHPTGVSLSLTRDTTSPLKGFGSQSNIDLPMTVEGDIELISDNNSGITSSNGVLNVHGDMNIEGTFQFRGTVSSHLSALDEFISVVKARDVTLDLYGSTGGAGQARLGQVTFASLVKDGTAVMSIESGHIRGDTTLTDGECTFSHLTIGGNLTVGADATIDFSNVVVLGNVTFISGATVTQWKGGYFLGTLTETAAELGGATAGSIINV